MSAVDTPLYQSQQIREFERLAQEQLAISESMLMQRAGKAAFEFLLKRWPEARKIAVFCGSGNNGGDGYVLAELAQAHGLEVVIRQISHHEPLKAAAKEAFMACQKKGMAISPFNAHEDLSGFDLLIDAICGIGLQADLREEVLLAVKKIAAANLPVLAIDVPTGINADTGCVQGAALHAMATITFIGLKLGLLTGNGVAYTGELVCNDLQLPQDFFLTIEPIARKINLNTYVHYLKPRTKDWHKGLSGHVLIIGGDAGYTGAPRMAAEAALRVGAGLVTVATHPDFVTTMNINCPEIMCHGVNTPEELEPLVAKADVIVIGPGLGQSAWAQKLWDFIAIKKLPKIVDADALNLLAKTNKLNEDWILTPHPGEAARLLNTATQAIQQDRLKAIRAINQRYQGVCVLKGAGSLVLAQEALPALCDKGNPGMASAGMGDVLSGVIGGLVGQGIPLLEAAKLGVCLHAMAGDLAAKEGQRGMLATDLMPYLRQLANTN